MTHYYALPTPDLWPIEGWVQNAEDPALWERAGHVARVYQNWDDREPDAPLKETWCVDASCEIAELAVYSVSPNNPKHRMA